MVDCWVCGAPNGAHREGCFNCGSLLATTEGAAGAEIERLTVCRGGEPGRVVYVRLQPRDDTDLPGRVVYADR